MAEISRGQTIVVDSILCRVNVFGSHWGGLFCAPMNFKQLARISKANDESRVETHTPSPGLFLVPFQETILIVE